MTYERLTIQNSVVVHRHLLYHDGHGYWTALGDNDSHLFGNLDEVLTGIARLVGSDDDLEALRAKLDQAIETSKRQHAEDELYRRRKAEREQSGR